MTNNPPEIDKCDDHKKWCLTKMPKKCQKVICYERLSWLTFKRKLLNLLYDSDSWSSDFIAKFSPLQSDIPITLLCLIVGVRSISRVLVVLQKINNVVVRCHYLCWVPLWKGAFFVTLGQWVPQVLRGFSHFD